MVAAHEPAHSTREDKDRHNVATAGRTTCDTAEGKAIEVQQKYLKKCIYGFQTFRNSNSHRPNDADGL